MAESEFALIRQHLEAALEKSAGPDPPRPTGDHDLYAALADAAARQRDPAALHKYAPLAEATATRIDHKLYMAIAQRAWGVAHALASEYAQAERRLNHALRMFQELDARWQIGCTFFELGELSRSQENLAIARDHFSRALIEFEQMRAAPYAARVRAALEELIKPEYPAGLTEREVEVLRWLARGLTNQEIAGKLVLSRRTVHAHLRSIYGKLDVTTRSAATRAAIENKIV